MSTLDAMQWSPTHWTLIVVTALITVLFLAALAIQAQGGRASARAVRLRAVTPGLLVSLGMFGTFVGVALGLYAFDPRAVETSLGGLFAGLQLAFVTSIAGIAGAIVLRLTAAVGGDARGGARLAAGSGQVSTPMAEAALRRMAEAAEQQVRVSQSLLSELQRGQAVVERQHAEQLTAFKTYAERVAEQGSATLVAALEQVIRDFNAQLGEAVGENFRQLDTSVARLLDWQERYRVHLESLGEQLTQATDGVSMSADSIERLTAHAGRLNAHIDEQSETLAALRRESEALESVLRAVASLRLQAESAMPAVEARLVGVLETLEDAVVRLSRRSGSGSAVAFADERVNVPMTSPGGDVGNGSRRGAPALSGGRA